MTNYLGEIRIFGGDYAPQDWLFCDGSLLSISAYTYLFSLLGTTYGGDGTRTFALPDLRGRLLVQNGQLTGGSNYPFAVPGGQEKVLLADADLPAHTHSVTVSTSRAITNHPVGNLLAAPVDDGNADDSSVLAYMPYNANDDTLKTVALHQYTIGQSGYPNADHENRQPYVAINYIIATQGLFPTGDE